MAETAGLAKVAESDTNLIQGGACGYYWERRRLWLPLPKMAVGVEAKRGAGAQEVSLPSPNMAAAVGAVPGSAPHPQPRLPRPSHRLLLVPSRGGAALPRRAGCRHLTWRQHRRLQRPKGMEAAEAGPGQAKPAARGRRRARGLWPRRTWSSIMW